MVALGVGGLKPVCLIVFPRVVGERECWLVRLNGSVTHQPSHSLCFLGKEQVAKRRNVVVSQVRHALFKTAGVFFPSSIAFVGTVFKTLTLKHQRVKLRNFNA